MAGLQKLPYDLVPLQERPDQAVIMSSNADEGLQNISAKIFDNKDSNNDYVDKSNVRCKN